MKILVASDSFKGCMSSVEANERIAKGLKEGNDEIETVSFPVSDGGEGLVEAFAAAANAQIRKAKVVDLYGREIEASFGYDPKTRTACIEAASVLGLTLYPRNKRRPMETSSYGLGLLLQEVLKLDVKKVIIGLGGTGSNDGGIGLLASFGAVCYNSARRVIEPKTKNLGRCAYIDKSGFRFPRHVQLIAACDVKNPLLGDNGATKVFGRQKGLSKSEQDWVEEGMKRFSSKVLQTFHVNMAKEEGSGAAGGLGGMLQSVFHAQFEPGIDLLCRMGHLEEIVQECDLVITGEGQTDSQTLCGKAVFGIAQRAQKHQVPVVCLSGALGLGYEGLYDYGVCSMMSTADRAMSFETAISQGPEKLENSARNFGRMLKGLKGCLK